MMPLACLGSPQDTLTEVVVNSLKWMKLGALGAFGEEREKRGDKTYYSYLLHDVDMSLWSAYSSKHLYFFLVFLVKMM